MTTKSQIIIQDLHYFWRKRYVLAIFTTLVTCIGLVYALLADRVYESQALITPKDIVPSLMGESMLSRVGGGMGNPFANTALLARVETVLKSRNQIRAMIMTHNLLPEIFPEKWDTAAHRWKDGVEVPTISEGIEVFRNRIHIKSDLYSSTIQIRIQSLDAIRARDLVNDYLDVFNQRVRKGLYEDAQDNRRFLERQLQETVDPNLQRRLQDAIVHHIQNSMIMNASAFEVLESPEVPQFGIKPKRKLIVVGSMASSFVLCMMVLFAWRRMPSELKRYLYRLQR